MSFSFSTYSIRNPIPAIVLFLVLTVAGLYAFYKLPITNMPDVSVPVIQVTVAQPGAAAAELETQVTRKVEDAVASVAGVKHITSNIQEGASVTGIEFYLETSTDRALNDVRDAVTKIRSELPRNAEDPVVERLDIGGGAILIYTVRAPNLSPMALGRLVDEELSRAITGIKGVAKVERRGGMDEEITVTLNPTTLAAYGITAADVSRQLTNTNINLPGGRVTLAGQEFSVRTLGSAITMETLGNTEIVLPGGRSAKLRTLGTLSNEGVEERNRVTLQGQPAVVMMVYKSKGASEVDVAKRVESALATLRNTHVGIEIIEVFSLVTPALESYSSTMMAFLEGTILTILVVFWFLRDKRSTVLAAMAIPLSIIPTFLVMHWLGFTLNAVSMLAITLVTGVLVDDAIVEIENIHRHMQEGKKPYDAAIIAVEEIGLAVIATTMVIMAVFMPVSFMGGIPGQFFIQFGITVATAAFFSLLVARLITPMLAAYWLKPHPAALANHPPKPPSPLLVRYEKLVTWTLDHRRRTLALAALSLVLSFGMIPFISAGFLPKEDNSQAVINVELPRGSTVAYTHSVAQQLANTLEQRPEVRYALVQAGDVAGGQNKANINLKLTDRGDRALTQQEFEADTTSLLSAVPDARVSYVKSDGGADVDITFLSSDSAALTQFTTQLEQQMRGISGLANIINTNGLQQPEIIITPDFAKGAALGISVQALSDAVNVALLGDADVNLAKFNTGTRQIPIRVQVDKANQTTLGLLETLQLRTSSGQAVPLSAVATLTYGLGPTTIERLDRERKISIQASLKDMALGDAANAINALPIMQNIPATVRQQTTGDAAVMAELFEGFAAAIITGLMLVYVVQVLLYKDWLQPFSRMIALPLSVGGAFFLLLITGTELNLPAIIGILMLMGIADKNSILLVDFMLELMARGVPRREAILQACMVRAQPIVMTSLAMMAGMMPIALGLGHDTAFRGPMAIAVIGGIISSTALSLVFVPVLFSYVRDFEEWLGPKARRLMPKQ
jgi:multidrug efflux pump subunit AcrB